jgi:quercetin dioxygenase-like cupin family protein
MRQDARGCGPAGGRPETAGRLAIGGTLRGARQAQGRSIASVAESAGLTKGFLSRLERDDVSASVASLLAVCDTLGLRIGQLFDPPADPLVPARQGGPVNLGGHGVVEQILTAANPHLLVIHSHIEPGGTTGDEPHVLDALVEFAYVVCGQLRLQVDDVDYVLSTGDALTFSAQAPHRWVNEGAEPVEVLWVLAAPDH